MKITTDKISGGHRIVIENGTRYGIRSRQIYNIC